MRVKNNNNRRESPGEETEKKMKIKKNLKKSKVKERKRAKNKEKKYKFTSEKIVSFPFFIALLYPSFYIIELKVYITSFSHECMHQNFEQRLQPDLLSFMNCKFSLSSNLESSAFILDSNRLKVFNKVLSSPKWVEFKGGFSTFTVIIKCTLVRLRDVQVIMSVSSGCAHNKAGFRLGTNRDPKYLREKPPQKETNSKEAVITNENTFFSICRYRWK